MKAKSYKYTWNLSLLFKDEVYISLHRVISEKVSYQFINKWKNRVDYLTNPNILRAALIEYSTLQKNIGLNYKEVYFYELKSALDESNPEIKGHLNKAIELSQKIQNDIQFFEIRLSKIDITTQKIFLDDESLKEYKHFLERLFAQADHILSEPEEKILTLKSLPAYENWVKMLSGFLSKEEAVTLDVNNKKSKRNISELLALMNNKDKEIRDSAAVNFNKILDKHLEVAENEINSVLQNKKTDDELRKFERPDSGRHLSDDIETEVVNEVIKIVSDNFKVSQKYYHLKAKLFKVDKLAYHERNVEYGSITNKYSFDESVEIVKKVTSELDNDFLQLFENFLSEKRIDVFPKKGKRGGAFCTHGLITDPVYILLNHNNQFDDVRTLAHELGHGINDELIKLKQNALNFGTPISTAEVSSTFFEDFVIEELMKDANEEVKLTLMMNKLNQDISSIFRQIAFYNFETELHSGFRKNGYLGKDEIGKIFQKNMYAYMGSYVEQTEGSQNWWVYVQHFRYFFYVYSYASGLLISKSLQASVKKDPKFILKVKGFLSAGLSESPKNIFAKLGIDISDKKFWEKGISEVDHLLTETEKLAKKLNKI